MQGVLILPLRFGIGRIERVEDARLAVFILQDMQRNQQLSKDITDEDILFFAEKVTQLKNKRHFDARKRRIYDIQALDSFLTLNGYTASQNAVYYSSLIDNWEFANNPWREAGKRFSIGAAPYYSFNHAHQLSSNKSDIQSFGADLFAEMYISRPLSLKWQKDIRLKGGFMRYKTNEDYSGNTEYIVKATSDEVYLAGSWGYGFYPDTRTFLNASLNANAGKTWIKPTESNIYPLDKFEYELYLSLTGYYYISERLSFNYSFSAGYGNTSYAETPLSDFHEFITSFNVSFTYAIF